MAYSKYVRAKKVAAYLIPMKCFRWTNLSSHNADAIGLQNEDVVADLLNNEYNWYCKEIDLRKTGWHSSW
jgi:hypothetical protein